VITSLILIVNIFSKIKNKFNYETKCICWKALWHRRGTDGGRRVQAKESSQARETLPVRSRRVSSQKDQRQRPGLGHFLRARQLQRPERQASDASERAKQRKRRPRAPNRKAVLPAPSRRARFQGQLGLRGVEELEGPALRQ